MWAGQCAAYIALQECSNCLRLAGRLPDRERQQRLYAPRPAARAERLNCPLRTGAPVVCWGLACKRAAQCAAATAVRAERSNCTGMRWSGDTDWPSRGSSSHCA
jgi:hypothetical protein